MQNVDVKRKGNKVSLTFDLDEDIGESASGKNRLIASTRGPRSVEDTEVRFVFTAYRPLAKKQKK
jgi:hypothetical protein